MNKVGSENHVGIHCSK